MIVDRRAFLVLSSAGLLIGARSSPAHATAKDAGLVQRFLSIAPDGSVTVFSKHVDMGQGIGTGLASIIAEELDADWAQIRVVDAPARVADYAHTIWGEQTTGGSTSIANSWDQLRLAGATARAMLLRAAAMTWGVAPQDIAIEKGRLRCGDRNAGFGAFAAAAARLPVPADATPKPRSAYRLLGREAPRLDMADKSRGRTRYGIDTNWPGIKTVVVAHAPRFGATLIGYDDSAARVLPGVREVVRIPSGVAVIADTTWHALRARAALKARWDESKAEVRSSEQLRAHFTTLLDGQSPLASSVNGKPDDALHATGNRIVEARFDFPYLAHAAMEPISVAGRLEGGACHLRGGFQAQTANQRSVAAILGLPVEQVFLETVAIGGSFGRRASFGPDWIDEFAHILKATKGRWPLKLIWSRDDDMAGGHYRPMTTHRFRAALDGNGDLLALQQDIVGQSFIPRAPDALPPAAPDIGVVIGHFADQYACPASRLNWWDPQVGISAHTYRAVSNNHCGVAKEIFVDRLARAAGVDPVAYRLALLDKEPRQLNVLRLAAEKFGWRRAPATGRHYGVAVHRADDSHVAQIVELSGAPDDFVIERVLTVVDCGTVLNPDVVRAQVEGGIGFGLSSALYQQIRLDESGRVMESNFHNYRIMRIPEMPRIIDVHIVESDEKPTGIGEPGSVPVVAAVVNALERMGHAPVRQFPVIGAHAA